MSGLAEILLALGHEVSGSDREKSPVTDYLVKKGAAVWEGHQAGNLAADTDYLVFSSAISGDNPEMRRAAQLNIPRIRRAEMLGHLFNRYFGIAVAGTHGKTTTTSMISTILIEADLDPTVVVGGRLHNLLTNARLGKSELMVTEADEYDRSFLTLFPRLAVLTSLEADHLDIYKGLDDLSDTFVAFANQVSDGGTVVYCSDDPNLKKIAPKFRRESIAYGFGPDARFRAADVEFRENKSKFSVTDGDQRLGSVQLPVPGRHNILNALAALIIALKAGVTIEQAIKGLENFKGVERRFDILGILKDIMIVDDYAHHPTELRVTLQSARDGWKRRLVAVFQPHLYSRTRDFYKEFAAALSIADEALITDIYPAREEPIEGVSARLIQEAAPEKIRYVADKDDLPQVLSDFCLPGDLVIFAGAGDIHQTAQEFYHLLKD